MNIKDFSALLKAKAAELNDFRHRKLPVLVGRTAKDHFQENFRQGGFVDGSLHPWQEAQRRKKGGKRASTKYGTLLSGRNHLFSSIKYIPGDSSVTVTNDVEYAALHNNGGQITTHPQVTLKMRKFAWAQYYQAAGITKRMKAGGKKRKAIEEKRPVHHRRRLWPAPDRRRHLSGHLSLRTDKCGTNRLGKPFRRSAAR